jgi:ABC-2 type transport system ATP-binding protein
MSARLGFSVAIDRDPDILIVDEVLAVGDERFQKKCREYFAGLIERKKTLIIVTHSLKLVEDLADEVILLSAGNKVFQGSPKEAVHHYRDDNYQTRLAG